MKEKLNRMVIKNILIQFLISAVVTIVLSLPYFSWMVLIPVILATLFLSMHEVNRNYLISVTPDGSDNSLVEFAYYNYLDKVKKETISKADIIDVKYNKKKIRLSLPDNRELNLYALDEKENLYDNII